MCYSFIFLRTSTALDGLDSGAWPLAYLLICFSSAAYKRLSDLFRETLHVNTE